MLQSLLMAVLHKLEAAMPPAGSAEPSPEQADIDQRFRVLLEAHLREEHRGGVLCRGAPRQPTAEFRLKYDFGHSGAK